MEESLLRNQFVDYFNRISPLSLEEKKAISSNMQICHFQKGNFLVKEGSHAADSYFILKGCAREYLIVDGEEKTTQFFTEGQWVISLANFDEEVRSLHSISCLEDTVVSVGNEKQAQELFKQFPRFETISRSIVEADFLEHKRQLMSFISETPEQRYIQLVKSRPDLVQRVPQYLLAGYIGVKPESLSRIRKRISQKK